MHPCDTCDLSEANMAYLTRQHGLLSKAAASEQDHVTRDLAPCKDHNITRHQLSGDHGTDPATVHYRHHPLLLHQLHHGDVFLPQVHQECCVGSGAEQADEQGKDPVPRDGEVEQLDILRMHTKAVDALCIKISPNYRKNLPIKNLPVMPCVQNGNSGVAGSQAGQ